MARVFISYTSELARIPSGESFAAAAVDAVTAAGHVAVHMKQFTAEPNPPAQVCRDAVRTCQIFVGLIGFRFGTPVRSENHRSYTELEFDEAVAAKLPSLIFLLDGSDPANLGESIDLDRPDLLARQIALRKRLQEDEDLTTASFRAPDGLRQLVREAVEKISPAAAATGRSGGRVPARRGSTGLPIPGRCLGRDGLLRRLTDALTGEDPPRLAVLGGPGIGKSTLIISALHNADVILRYGERRWFVRCDGAASGEALLTVIAAELGAVGEIGRDLRQRIRQVLDDGPALLVLDNLETPWGADPLGAEDVLRDLAEMSPSLAVVATIRGVGWPVGVDWDEFFILPPLDPDAARAVFLTIAGRSFAADPDLGPLLAQMDGVPLAVELLAYNAQGYPDLSELSERWHSEKATLLARGAADRRELSVPVSVEISIRGPAMTPDGIRLITLLGLLPDGLARDSMADVLSGTGLAGAAVLRRTGLAFDAAGRLRLLAPVRQHVAAAHSPEDADRLRLISHFCQLAASLGMKVGRAGGGEAATRLAAEAGNLRDMLTLALESREETDVVVDGAVGLAELQRLTGVVFPGLLDAVAASVRDGSPALRARLLRALGGVAVHRADRAGADDAFRQALALCVEAGDLLGQANAIQGLGHSALVVADHRSARAAYQRALPLFEQLGNKLGQALCVMSLGDAAYLRFDYAAALEFYRRALPLYEECGDLLGQGNCYRSLGDIALARSAFDESRRCFDRAFPLFEQVGSVLGLANCTQGRGDIAFASGDYEQARREFERALPMYRQFGDPLGQANCIQGLGDLALTRLDVDGARAAFERATALFVEVGDLLGQANCVQGVGDVAALSGDDAGARESYQRALALYEGIPAPRSVYRTQVLLAHLAVDADDRENHLAAAVTWGGVDRADVAADLALPLDQLVSRPEGYGIRPHRRRRR